MRAVLLLLVLGASMLTADAVSCYSCSACSSTYTASEVTTSTGCNYCGKTTYGSVSTVTRTCLPICVQAVVDGYGLYCCNSDNCNSAVSLQGAKWLLLLPAAALAVIYSRH